MFAIGRQGRVATITGYLAINIRNSATQFLVFCGRSETKINQNSHFFPKIFIVSQWNSIGLYFYVWNVFSWCGCHHQLSGSCTNIFIGDFFVGVKSLWTRQFAWHFCILHVFIKHLSITLLWTRLALQNEFLNIVYCQFGDRNAIACGNWHSF